MGLACTGDRDAWDALVARYAPLLWAVARGHGLDAATAVEVAQTCWLRLAEQLPALDPSNVGTWIATTGREESRRVARWVTLVDLTTTTTSETGNDVWRAMSSLPPRCRLALRLVALEPSPSDSELGAALGLDADGVGAALAQCLQRLAQTLSPSPDPDRVST